MTNDTVVRDESWLDRPLFARLDLEKLAYGGLIVLALITRLYDLGARAMSHDESLHTYFSFNLATGRGFQHTPLMHGPFLFHITALSFFLFGDSDFTARLPFALLGVLAVGLAWLFRRWLGRPGALVLAIAILISPSNMYYARYIRQEASIIVWTMLTVFSTWRYMETRGTKWLVVLTAVLALHAADKSTSFFTVAQALVFLAPLVLIQLNQARRPVSKALVFVAYVGGALLAACLVFQLAGRVMVDAFAPTMSIGADNTPSINAGTLEMILVFTLLGAAATLGLAQLTARWFGQWIHDTEEIAPAFNPIVMMVTTTMFMASPAVLLIFNPIWRVFSGKDLVDVAMLGNMSMLNNNMPLISAMLAFTVALISVAVAIGLVWDWKRWLRLTGLFLAITIPLFTTLFTNFGGLGTGFVGQLGYWMAQQPVMRGSQPWYYYFIVVPLYEYALIIGALLASIMLVRRLLTQRFAPAPVLDGGLLAPARTPRAAERPKAVPATEPKIRTISLGFIEIKVQSNERLEAAPAGDIVAAHAASIGGDHERRIKDFGQLFPTFLIWWMISNWLTYTAAGEKMPWLTIHIALPMAMLTGWFINELLHGGLNAWRELDGTRKLWLGALSVLILLFAVQVLSSIGGWPDRPELRAGAVAWLVVKLIALGGAIYAARRVIRDGQLVLRGVVMAMFALLAVLTARTAMTASFINADYTKEFLFYAHGGNTVKTGLDQVTELSQRLTGGNAIKIGYDSDSSWPLSWYMRDFPNASLIGDGLPQNFNEYDVFFVGDYNKKRDEFATTLAQSYTQYRYMLVWWPMEDYKNISLAATLKNAGNPQWRAAIWDIIFNRDYKKYSDFYKITSLTPETWSPGHPYYLYVRNDVATRVWDFRTEPAVAAAPGAPAAAVAAMPAAAAKPGSYAGIAFLGNDRVVADYRTHRISRIDANGDVQASWGGLGSGAGKFNAPWGVTVDSNQNILVADTFNHRIVRFDRDGNLLATWGVPGVTNAPGNGKTTSFFGPRDLMFDNQNRLLVSDTGNKRIQVFDAEGNFITQFGTSGEGDGQFNEPVGVAGDSAGNIYVADTWNKRIQVFDQNFRYVRQFPVAEWSAMKAEDLQAVDNKPYLAISGSTLYVSTPKLHRVLAFRTDGARVELPTVTFSASALPTGLTVRGSKLYVTDAAGGGILDFDIAPN